MKNKANDSLKMINGRLTYETAVSLACLSEDDKIGAVLAQTANEFYFDKHCIATEKDVPKHVL